MARHPRRGVKPALTIEVWRRYYNTAPPHSSLGYRPSVPGNSFSTTAAFRFRLAPPPGANGNRDGNALTIKPDHSVGAGHDVSGGGRQIARLR